VVISWMFSLKGENGAASRAEWEPKAKKGERSGRGLSALLR